MEIMLSIIVVYFIVLLCIGYLAQRQERKTAEDYFLAGRGIGSFVMTVSVFSTLYSAFTFIALPGLVYKTGFGFIPGLAVSNILFPAVIFLVGYKIWLAGKKFHFITPTELFRHRFNSAGVEFVVFVVMVLLVTPYISIQPIGGGYVLAAITEGRVPYTVAAGIITLVMILYSVMGGFRGIAWVDTFQGLVMLIVSTATLVAVASLVGGFGHGTERVMTEMPAHLTPSGPIGLWTWPLYFSWVVFIFFNFMFQPQIFSRYYSGKSPRTLAWTLAIWPLMAGFMLVPPAIVALYGHLLVPDLARPDQIIPILWTKFLPAWFVGFGAAAVLSALMSTAAGQLMVLSSMWTRDIYVGYLNKNASEVRQVWMGRIAIIVLAVLGYAIALKPPALMGLLAGAAFSGIAILAPAGFAAFYWRRATAPAVMISIVGGEIPVFFTYFGIIPKATWGTFDASIPGLIIALVLLIVVSYLTAPPPKAIVDAYMSSDMDIFKAIRNRSA
jgi:solute:Na+ symporter, SSS family